MKVGFIGLAGAGKDTAALLLQEALLDQGHNYRIERYAGLLKEATRQVFGDTFDDREVKEVPVFVTPALADKIIDATDYVQLKLGLNPEQFDLYTRCCVSQLDSLTWISPRTFQQVLGSIGRCIDDLIWVRNVQSKEGNYLVPDVRFDNERCDYNILILRNPVPQGQLHASEVYAAELNMCDEPHLYVDAVIYNDSDMVSLKHKLSKLVPQILARG